MQRQWGNAGMVCPVNFFLGFMVTAVTGFPPIALVPLVVSAAGALANGIYCFTGAGLLANDYYRGAVVAGSVNRYMAASFFADTSWLVSRPLLLLLRVQGRLCT